jgi:hypothetical protein
VHEGEFVVLMFAIIVLSGVGLMIAAMFNRRRFREMEHRERLAMIERGLLPAPESDPGAFESGARFPAADPEAGVRYRTAGVLMMGLGFGLIILITFTVGEAGVGLGVGGGWAVLGAASLLNYFLITKREQDLTQARRRWTPPPAPRPHDPPTGNPL